MGALEAGAAIGERESIRTGPGAHAVLQLADGSTVDVNERTELFVTAAWSGQTIHLQRGDIIVKAAKQRRGSLRVLTRDSIASVKGTVFAVSAGMGGSVVSVVEGSVAVNQPRREVVLSPGQQAASIPALASSVAQAVSWSPEADYYLELLGSLVKIERELASFPAELRTNSALLSYLPAGAVVYGTVPNLGQTIGRALTLADEQSAQNAAFRAWWNSETGQGVRQMTDRLQSVNPLLGDEIVFIGQPDRERRARTDGDGPGAARQAGGARQRPGQGFSPRRARFLQRIRFPTTCWSFQTHRRTWRGPSLTWGRAPAPRLRQPSAERYQRGVGLARRDRCAPVGHDGGWRRRAANRAGGHDRDEVPLPRAAGAHGCGRERGHARVPGGTNGNGVVAG